MIFKIIYHRLNNNGHGHASALNMFDVSWLSRFPDENERVFAGGMVTIRVEAVRTVETNKVYKTVFDALYIIDSMVSDGRVNINDFKINSKVMDVMNKFINFQQASSSMDSYMASMVKSYIRRKKKIVINFHMFLFSKLKKEIYGMIIEDEVKEDETENCDVSDIKSRANLLSSNIFKIFPNVQDIVIKTSSPYDNGFSYPFNMFYLLKIIQSSSTWRTINIQQMKTDLKNKTTEDISWINKLWSKSSNKLMQEFGKKKLKIDYQTEIERPGRGCYLYSYLNIERLST